MAEQPMTKAEALRWIRRAREGLRDAERAIREGNEDDLREALVEASAAPVEIQNAIEENYHGGEEPRGIRGVS